MQLWKTQRNLNVSKLIYVQDVTLEKNKNMGSIAK